MKPDAPQPIALADYRPPDYRIPTIDLSFALAPHGTKVTARMAVEVRPGAEGRPLILNGVADLVEARLDDRPLTAADFKRADETMVIDAPPARFTLTIVTMVAPEANTALQGLYRSNGIYCTQCEAEGFRAITYFIDRPDILSVYTVRIVAPPEDGAVLLSNGNLIESGIEPDGRRFAVWHDPFPKPCYLFALVAGRLEAVTDSFTTASGRPVRLSIWVEPGQGARCLYAMDALKRAMRWDEEVFGLEYDLDEFNVVAVSDFNMGAMENKSLNIFNAAYVLASPETATDADYARIESVVAHEYFHNWTGNRVTCRDWFQLSLKEGLTVFRDQEFSADQRGRAISRIGDVRRLRARQFPEDSGPLAHAVRPGAYIEISNFYTATIYEKGAEVIRMMARLLGRERFLAGHALYIARHDGTAATVEDFVAAMADAGDRDLSAFFAWYDEAGTPELRVKWRHDRDAGLFEIEVAQSTPPTPGQPNKRPKVIPLALGLVNAAGRDVPLVPEGAPTALEPDAVLVLDTPRRAFRFTGITEPVTPSLNRGFAAPVRLVSDHGPADEIFLMGHDPDPFARFEAGQSAMLRDILARVADPDRAPDPGLIAAIGRTLADAALDPAFIAEAITPPTERFIADQMDVVDVDGIHRAREALKVAVAAHLGDALRETRRRLETNAPFTPDAAAAGRRALRNAALAYLAAPGDDRAEALALDQYRRADNMTDRLAALVALTRIPGPARATALEDFLARHQGDALVEEKWLEVQALSPLPETTARVATLMDHPVFKLTNPNKVRSLLGAFGSGNPVRFHQSDGAGYRLLGAAVARLDPINPQVAARIVEPLCQWRRVPAEKARAMRAELRHLLDLDRLSKDTFEIVSKSVGQ